MWGIPYDHPFCKRTSFLLRIYYCFLLKDQQILLVCLQCTFFSSSPGPCERRTTQCQTQSFSPLTTMHWETIKVPASSLFPLFPTVFFFFHLPMLLSWLPSHQHQRTSLPANSKSEEEARPSQTSLVVTFQAGINSLPLKQRMVIYES